MEEWIGRMGYEGLWRDNVAGWLFADFTKMEHEAGYLPSAVSEPAYRNALGRIWEGMLEHTDSIFGRRPAYAPAYQRA